MKDKLESKVKKLIRPICTVENYDGGSYKPFNSFEKLKKYIIKKLKLNNLGETTNGR